MLTQNKMDKTGKSCVNKEVKTVIPRVKRNLRLQAMYLNKS